MALALNTLVYARRLREAGISEEQAVGHAEALAEAMTDAFATKQDLDVLSARMDARFSAVDARFAAVDARFDHMERHFDVRLVELEHRMVLRMEELEKRITAQFDGKLSSLEGRLTSRLGGMMVAGIGVVSVLVKLL